MLSMISEIIFFYFPCKKMSQNYLNLRNGGIVIKTQACLIAKSRAFIIILHY